MGLIPNATEIAQKKYLEGKSTDTPSIKSEIHIMAEQELASSGSYISEPFFSKNGFDINVFATTSVIPTVKLIIGYGAEATETTLSVSYLAPANTGVYNVFKATVNEINQQCRIEITNNSGVAKNLFAKVNYTQPNLSIVKDYFNGDSEIIPSVTDDILLMTERELASSGSYYTQNIFINTSGVIQVKTNTSTPPSVYKVEGYDTAVVETALTGALVSPSEVSGGYNLFEFKIDSPQKSYRFKIVNNSGVSKLVSAYFYKSKKVELDTPYIYGTAELSARTTGFHAFYLSKTTDPYITTASENKISNFLSDADGWEQNVKYRRFRITIWSNLDEAGTVSILPYSRVSASSSNGQFSSTVVMYKSATDALGTDSNSNRMILSSLEKGENTVNMVTVPELDGITQDLCIGIDFTVAPTSGKIVVVVEAQK